VDDIISKLRESCEIIKYDVEKTGKTGKSGQKSEKPDESEYNSAILEYNYYNNAQNLYHNISTNESYCQFTLMPISSNTIYNALFKCISSNNTIRYCIYDIIHVDGLQYIEVQ